MNKYSLPSLFLCAAFTSALPAAPLDAETDAETIACKKIVVEKSDSHPPAQQLNAIPLTILSAKNVRHVFNAEVPMTWPEWKTGLMYRHRMDENAGMLFIGKDGKVKHIHENTEPCSKTMVFSQEPAIGFLELNAGEVKKRGLNVGDRVLHPFFK